MQRLEVGCAVRLIYTSLGAKGLIQVVNPQILHCRNICEQYKQLFFAWIFVKIISSVIRDG